MANFLVFTATESFAPVFFADGDTIFSATIEILFFILNLQAAQEIQQHE